eukprot:gb/GECG01012508.1/.p1 GENE.gb/GECG01012508.1/~~gb/GECG01012508.1/.p1  ORF type:complete len:226 (+),score=19.70 gb/GECG01012508.1/:1-678(+)
MPRFPNILANSVSLRVSIFLPFKMDMIDAIGSRREQSFCSVTPLVRGHTPPFLLTKSGAHTRFEELQALSNLRKDSTEPKERGHSPFSPVCLSTDQSAEEDKNSNVVVTASLTDVSPLSLKAVPNAFIALHIELIRWLTLLLSRAYICETLSVEQSSFIFWATQYDRGNEGVLDDERAYKALASKGKDMSLNTSGSTSDISLVFFFLTRVSTSCLASTSGELPPA